MLILLCQIVQSTSSSQSLFDADLDGIPAKKKQKLNDSDFQHLSDKIKSIKGTLKDLLKTLLLLDGGICF